jgi:hypothetical protein
MNVRRTAMSVKQDIWAVSAIWAQDPLNRLRRRGSVDSLMFVVKKVSEQIRSAAAVRLVGAAHGRKRRRLDDG